MSLDWITEPCTACDKVGYLHDPNDEGTNDVIPCPTCGGSGVVPSEQAIEVSRHAAFRKADQLGWEGEDQFMGELIEIVDAVTLALLNIQKEYEAWAKALEDAALHLPGDEK